MMKTIFLIFAFALALADTVFGDRADDACSSQPDSGECITWYPKYYFDRELRQCVRLKFLGGEGNGNKFDSEEDCYDECEKYVDGSDIPSDSICNLPPDYGRCETETTRFYFDQKTGKCRAFSFYGSYGNSNNFQNPEDCIAYCIRKDFPNLPTACLLEKDRGICQKREIKYYYNKRSGECEAFMYSGCAGNPNHFPSKQSCEGYCKENYKKDLRPCPCARSAPQQSSFQYVAGGKPTGQYEFPFAANFARRKHVKPFCGGNLITDRHVLTAAHCVHDEQPKDFVVDVGDYDVLDTRDGQYIPVQNITVHPGFMYHKNLNNDIAIVELQSPVEFNKATKTIPLPKPDFKVEPGTRVTIYGWGWSSLHGESPAKLHAVEVPVVDCKTIFRSLPESTICAGGEEGKSSCMGDSGSGLVELRNNQHVLIGLASASRCGFPGIPAFGPRVSSFTKWILENTRRAGCKPCLYNE